MVLSSLSALIAQSQEKQQKRQGHESPSETSRPGKRQKVSSTSSDHTDEATTRQKSPTILKRPARGPPKIKEKKCSGSHEEQVEDRKPAAKRKRRVGFEGAKDEDEDVDSLYREDEYVHENIRNNDEAGSEQDFYDPESFQNHYTRAFEALYGPAQVPSAASAPGAAASTVGPMEDYLQSLQQVFEPDVSAGIQYFEPHEHKQPKLKQRLNRRTKKWETVEETAEEAERRFHLQQRRNERKTIEAKWKRRIYNWQKEEDIGGAMYQRAKRQLRDKLVREQQEAARQQTAEKEEEEIKQSEAKAQQVHDDEDSVQEQQDVMDRLTQQSNEGSDKDDKRVGNASDQSAATSDWTVNDTIQQLMSEDLSLPLRSRMDYWSAGYGLPRDLEIDPFSVDLTPRLKPGEKCEDPDKDDDGPRLSLKFLRSADYADAKHNYWQPTYFPTHPPDHQSPYFYRYRLIQSVATRLVCGGSLGEDAELEDRYLRLLFSHTRKSDGETMARFAPSYTYLRLSHQLGCNALMYLKNVWYDPVEVAEKLWLLQVPPMVGNSPLAGRMQKPGTILIFFKKQRKKVMEYYKVKSRPWDYEDTTTIDPSPALPKYENHAGEEVAASRSSSNEQEDDNIEPALGNATDQTKTEMDSRTEAENKEVTTLIDGYDDNDDVDEASPVVKTETVEEGMARSVRQVATSEVEESFTDGVKSCNTPNTAAAVIDLRTTKSSVNEDVFSQGPGWQLTIKEAALFPTSTFSHIPGTCPPVPPFPLDPVGILFGPIDRHSKYDHQEIRVHHGMFQIALSTLLTRVARYDESNKSNVRKRIQSMLQKYVDITMNKQYKMKYVLTKGRVKDIPLIQFYRAVQVYCSYWANGFPALEAIGENTAKQEFDSTIKTEGVDALYIDENSNTANTWQVAVHLFDFLENYIDHNGLARFPQLRVTFALASLVPTLPSGAADIISGPLDDNTCPTPIHKMRQMCEFLEENGFIRGAYDLGHGSGDQSKRAAEWEYLFFEIAQNFEACIKVAPADPEYHAWYIGTLAVCVLLGSGNRIGSLARRFPSAKSIRGYEQLNQSQEQSLEHEVREKLPKFEEVAAQVSSAIRILFALVKHQPGARAHMAVAAVLEWKQLIALLIGETLDTHLETLSTLYESHAYQRYVLEQSDVARHSAMKSADRPDFWANQIENNPADIQHWRSLIMTIGSAGEDICDSSNTVEHRKNCEKCQLLREPRVLNHELQEHDSTWWGRGRKWWASSLLQLRNQKPVRSRYITEPVVKKLEELGCKDLPSSVAAQFENRRKESSNAKHLAWLPTRDELRLRQLLEPTIPERETTFDKQLPPFIDKRISVKTGLESPQLASMASIPEKIEVLGYKILILCHLVGPADPTVEQRIYPLIRASWDTQNGNVKETCPEFRILKWLFDRDIDIPKMARMKYPKRHSRKALRKQD